MSKVTDLFDTSVQPSRSEKLEVNIGIVDDTIIHTVLKHEGKTILDIRQNVEDAELLAETILVACDKLREINGMPPNLGPDIIDGGDDDGEE